MRRTELEKIIDDANLEYFRQLLPGIDLKEGESLASRVVDSKPKPGATCFCGALRGQIATASNYAKHVTLADASGPIRGGRVAVGAVVDDMPFQPDDLEVIIAVGINYAQGDSYLNSPVPLIDSTGMRGKLNPVLTALSSHHQCSGKRISTATDFHLVVMNIFPWITTVAWSQLKFNAIEESLFIRCLSGVDAAVLLDPIIEGIGTKLRAVVFHGANNAVPFWGAQWARVNPAAQGPLSLVFCDNLAKGHTKIYNAVYFC